MSHAAWRRRAGTTFELEKRPAIASREMVAMTQALNNLFGSRRTVPGAAIRIPSGRPRHPRAARAEV